MIANLNGIAWHKIVLHSDRINNQVFNDIRNRLLDAHLASGKNPEVRIYTPRKKPTEFRFPIVFYFSPVASTYCSEILDDYSAEPCEEPNSSTLDVWAMMG